MLEAKFIASGSSFEEALQFSCELTANLYLGESGLKRSRKIDIYCDDLKQAEKLDELLWEIPKELLLPHQLAHKINLDEPIDSKNINLVAKKPINEKVDYALSNSFGFGGTNTALLFKGI